MANAPAPQVFSETYKDFNLTFISQEETTDGNYKQHFTLNNTGKGYIERISLDDVYELEFYGSYMHDFNPYQPFCDSVFEPGYNGELVLTSGTKMPDFTKVKAKAEGYYTFVKDLPVEGTKEITEITKSSASSNYFYYKIDLGLKLPDTYYEYGAILKFNYKDTICYVKVSEGRDYTIETNEELELDKLTVLDVVGIKSEPYLTHQLGCGGSFSTVLTIVIIVFVLFAIMISFGIFAAIFFPAMARRRRRRRAALQSGQNR